MSGQLITKVTEEKVCVGLLDKLSRLRNSRAWPERTRKIQGHARPARAGWR